MVKRKFRVSDSGFLKLPPPRSAAFVVHQGEGPCLACISHSIRREGDEVPLRVLLLIAQKTARDLCIRIVRRELDEFFQIATSLVGATGAKERHSE